MRNWYGNHKIGIFGLSNTGKTVFLTSLLWHLKDHHPDLFPLSDNGHIGGFEFVESKDHDFNYIKHKTTFVKNNSWPEKTCDYTIAKCKYKITGSKINVGGVINKSWNLIKIGAGRQLCERHISFLDIPGERVSDILIWKAKDYHDWVKRLYKFWQNDPETEKIMSCFCELAEKPDVTLKQLVETYKRAMWYMIDACCPITPSTYFLGTDGSMLGEKKYSDRETAIQERSIWSGGELLPLPESWAELHPLEYKEMEKQFVAYRKQVLKPLFDEINRCDNFIFCIDIPQILNNGPTHLLYTQQTFLDFIKHLAPGKFKQVCDKIAFNPPRLAYVATKADMVVDKAHLESLLKDFCASLNFAGINQKYFICSACISSEDKMTRNGIKVKVGRDIDNPNNLLVEPHELPIAFPANWDPESFFFQEIAPKPQFAIRPPEQVNLNKVFEFIVEGIYND